MGPRLRLEECLGSRRVSLEKGNLIISRGEYLIFVSPLAAVRSPLFVFCSWEAVFTEPGAKDGGLNVVSMSIIVEA